MCDCKELLTPCNDLHVDDRNSTHHEVGYDLALEVDIIGNTCAIGVLMGYWNEHPVGVMFLVWDHAMALLEGAEAAVYMSGIIQQLTGTDAMRICCLTDNKSLCEALSSSKQIEDKRLRIDISVLDDMRARGEIDTVEWVPTSHQLPFCLTKRGVSSDR